MLRHAYRLNRLRSRYYIGGTVTNFNPQYLIIPRIDRSTTTFRYQTHGPFLEHSFGGNWFTAKNPQLEPGNVIRKRKSHFCANVILLLSIRITIIKSKIIPWCTLVYFILKRNWKALWKKSLWKYESLRIKIYQTALFVHFLISLSNFINFSK